MDISCSRAFLTSAAILLLSVFSNAAHAVLLSYEQISQSGNHYEYSYSITNDDLVVGIEEFSIFFEANAYQNLAITASPTGWDPLAIEPDPILGDGFVDWLALFATPIFLGETLGGFNVSFDWIGQAPVPTGSQFFEVLDPFSFAPLASGQSSREGVVSEPSSLGLLGLSLLLLTVVRVKRRK